MNGPGRAAAPPARRERAPAGSDAAEVLAEIRSMVAAHFGTFAPEDIRADVDVLGDHPLVEGRPLDSLDLVEVLGMVEERFGVELSAALTGDEPLTLATVARHIASAGPAW